MCLYPDVFLGMRVFSTRLRRFVLRVFVAWFLDARYLRKISNNLAVWKGIRSKCQAAVWKVLCSKCQAIWPFGKGYVPNVKQFGCLERNISKMSSNLAVCIFKMSSNLAAKNRTKRIGLPVGMCVYWIPRT